MPCSIPSRQGDAVISYESIEHILAWVVLYLLFQFVIPRR